MTRDANGWDGAAYDRWLDVGMPDGDDDMYCETCGLDIDAPGRCSLRGEGHGLVEAIVYEVDDVMSRGAPGGPSRVTVDLSPKGYRAEVHRERTPVVTLTCAGDYPSPIEALRDLLAIIEGDNARRDAVPT